MVLVVVMVGVVLVVYCVYWFGGVIGDVLGSVIELSMMVSVVMFVGLVWF